MLYLTNTSELTAVADAIREKGGTSAPLTYPFGYVSAIQDIQTGDINALIDRTISGVYENSTVTTVGYNAFRSCAELTEVSFPRVTTISTYAFTKCDGLETANFPVCTQIGNQAFQSCSMLTTISFPSCTDIGNSAFQSCQRLEEVNFPACTTIGSLVFANSPIESVSFPVCSFIGSNAFMSTQVTTADFPACNVVGSAAFLHCGHLTTASFPVCTVISSSAFANGHMLVELHLMGESVASLINSNAFGGTPIGGYSASAGQYGSIYVPASLLTAYQTATNWTFFSSRFVGV